MPESPILQIRCHPFIFKILKETGKKNGRSPHLEARRLILERMWEEQMLPEGNLQDMVSELLYGIKQKSK